MEKQTFKILSWNINGIKSGTSLKERLDSLQADIICFQETKTTRDQVDEATVNIEGYTSYFSFSKRRSGYSGVATFCKDNARPFAAEEGLTGFLVNPDLPDIIGNYGNVKESYDSDILQSLDSEGRAILTKHKIRLKDSKEVGIVIINVYCPRADPERPDRKEYKLRFYELLQRRAEAILNSGSHVVIVGDINTSHQPIDRCEMENEEEFYLEPSRAWLSKFLYDSDKNCNGRFFDCFRHFHPDEKCAFTCWSTATNARENNYGHRIDYIFSDYSIIDHSMVDSVIMPHVKGSDHCPVAATFSCLPIASTKWPSFCTRNWPEFSGKQTKLSNFVQRTSKNSISSVPTDSKKHKLETSKGLPTQKNKQPKLDGFLLSTKSSKSDEPTREPEKKLNSSPCGTEKASQSPSTVNAWKSLLKGPPPPPMCRGHKEPAVLRMSKKPGQNFKRQFYACARPEGYSNDPNANCKFFQWVNNVKSK
ncbi:DNA-(apurinic or apyrimidinic site) lyase 2 [Chamberlinius hualienensis]